MPAAAEHVESDEEGPPSPKKEKLTDMSDELELESIEKGEKLTDLHINYAQQLIKCQFPLLNGLQSTLYQAKKPACTATERPPSDNSQSWRPLDRCIHR